MTKQEWRALLDEIEELVKRRTSVTARTDNIADPAKKLTLKVEERSTYVDGEITYANIDLTLTDNKDNL